MQAITSLFGRTVYFILYSSDFTKKEKQIDIKK